MPQKPPAKGTGSLVSNDPMLLDGDVADEENTVRWAEPE